MISNQASPKHYQVSGAYSYLGDEVGFIGAFDVGENGTLTGHIKDRNPNPRQSVEGKVESLDGKLEMTFVKAAIGPQYQDIHYKLLNSSPNDGFGGRYEGFYYFEEEAGLIGLAHSPSGLRVIWIDFNKTDNRAHLTLTSVTE